jgi:hypothetical protein
MLSSRPYNLVEARAYKADMKSLLLIAALSAFDVKPAHAYAACNSNNGLAPRSGVALPPRAKLVAFADQQSWESQTYAATLDGVAVKLVETKKKAAPYYLTELEVVSSKRGTLKIYRGTKAEGTPLATYTVKSNAKLPREVAATTSRFTHTIQRSTVSELFDALAIDLGDAPAILATVKIRRDDKAAWTEWELPIHTGGWMEQDQTKILIGALGCTSNYTPGLLEQGVDLEVRVTLPDGKKVRVKLPERVVLPKAAPQP